MKLIIDIPEVIYLEKKEDYIGDTLDNAIKNGTPLPDNATNGDMFQKIYDVWDYEKGEYTIEVFMENCIARFSLEWWNAPYKKGENND